MHKKMVKRPILTLMCGIPRVGKSTWLKENRGNAVIVSPDDIRREFFGHQFHAPANKFVFGIAEGMVTLILKQGHDVIIDATHITEKLRSAWRTIAIKCGADARVVWIYAYKKMNLNFLACLERNKKSPKEERLPIDALARMAMYFEAPTPKMEGGWFKLETYRNSPRRKVSIKQRIIVDKDDDILEVLIKWRAKWDAAGNNEDDS